MKIKASTPNTNYTQSINFYSLQLTLVAIHQGKELFQEMNQLMEYLVLFSLPLYTASRLNYSAPCLSCSDCGLFLCLLSIPPPSPSGLVPLLIHSTLQCPSAHHFLPRPLPVHFSLLNTSCTIRYSCIDSSSYNS